MPIVVAVLGVIIVVMGFVFFTTSPAEEKVVTEEASEMNRTEEMEKADETVVGDESLSDPVVSQDDSNTSVASNTLTGSGTYQTPARTTHELDVTLTIESGVVTDAKVVYDKGEGFSNPHQERFDNAYKAEVIGKSLNDISLSRVGGASLTSEGFNQAIASIKSQQS